jgi:TRAP transporter TAXI family solute receptor
MADILLELYGVDKKSVKIIETVESNETADALKVGSVDAAILPGGLRAGYILDLAQSADLVFLKIPDDKMDALVKRMGPAFYVTTIPANTYRGQTEEVKALAMPALLVCRQDLDQETVYKITKALFSSHDEMKNGHVSGADWNLKNTLKSEPIPFHPGAIRYFKEIGAWNKS